MQRLARLLLAPLLIALLAFIPSGSASVQQAAAQDITVIPGTVAVPGDAAQVVREVLQRSVGYAGAARYFAVTGYDCDGQVCFASVTGFKDAVDPSAWTFEQVSFVGSIVLRKRASGTLAGMLDTEPGYLAFLADSAGASAQVLRASAAQTETVSYDFPWQPGTSTVYGSLGVHKGGFIDGWKAVDFLSDANASLNHAPNKLLAAAPGTISYVCDDGTNAAARIGDLIYVHLIGNPKLKVGQKIERGEELGQLKPGTYSTRCGYASQQPQNFHVHLAFPDTGSFTMGGWTLTLADGIWRRSANGTIQTWKVGQWLRNDALPPPTATPTPISGACPYGGLGDANCDGQIDGKDYSDWLAAQCASACGERGADFNRDGTVDGDDYALWLANRRTTRNAGRARTELVTGDGLVRLYVLPLADASGGALPLSGTIKFAIQAVFDAALITETLHYARVEVAAPGQVLSIDADSEVDVTPSGLGRKIELSSAKAAHSSGLIRLELGAQTPPLAPGTQQTITLGTFSVDTTARSLGAWFMLYGAEFVTSDLRSWPIQYMPTAFSIAPSYTFLPHVSKD